MEEQLLDPLSLLNYCRRVNRLKLEVPAIARGMTQIVLQTDTLCLLQRTWQDHSCWIAMNFSRNVTQEVAIPSGTLQMMGDLEVDDGHVSVVSFEDTTTVQLPGWAIAVFSEP